MTKTILLLTACIGVCADTLSVIAVGDVMFANYGTNYIDSLGVDYPLKGVKDELKNADLRICNLEQPVSDTGVAFQKTYTFKAPVRHAGLLVDGGFDVVHLANNHILDNGEVALKNTFKVLDSLGIPHIGAGMNQAEARKPVILARKGKKIGFLGYSLTFPEEFWAAKGRPGTAFGDSGHIRADIAALRPQVDYLFVVFHWGAEKMTVPKPYQRGLGRLCIDSGADAVFGHHPHVLQGIELYKGKIIAYSLGNFCFATWTNAVWDSAILRLFFSEGRFLKAESVPVLINNYQVHFQPRILTGEGAQKSLNGLAALCDSVGTKLKIEGERGWIYPDTSTLGR